MSDEPAVSLLLLLRLKAFAPTEVISSSLGVPADELAVVLSEMADSGWVQHRSGMAAGWSLTPQGRRHGERLLRDELERAGTAGRVDACYQDFLPLNAELLAVCTDWQTVVVAGEHLPNDHTDAERDAAILARLDALHRRTVPVLEALAASLTRFAPYADRLGRAHEHVRAGRTEWIAKPTVDSYHGIWFELHEHLLVTLGRDRVSEAVPQYVPTQTGESR